MSGWLTIIRAQLFQRSKASSLAGGRIAAARSSESIAPRKPSNAAPPRPGAGLTVGAQDQPDEFPHRVVELVHDALLERNDRVVGDRDVFGANLGATFRDVAVTDAVLGLQFAGPVGGVERVHFQGRRVN